MSRLRIPLDALKRAAVLLVALATAVAGVLLTASPAQAHHPPEAGDFDQVRLSRGGATLGEPMGLAVLPDGGALTTDRSGKVLYTAEAGDTRTAATLDVYTHDEQGVQGIAVDPKFDKNKWVYIYYSPALDTPEGDAPTTGEPEDFEAWKGHNQLSRFKFDEKAGTLDLDSEQKILEIPSDRGICCHAGGDIDFDDKGLLYLSVGDNTNPFESDGYAPIDDSEGRNPAFDARRTSGNTNDLRGKLLRIDVKKDGSYKIPQGNLFEKKQEDTRPEIYAMGLRNPFRFDLDPETGTVWLGEYGPDAGEASDRGPQGMVSYHRIAEPANFGWPFCVGDKTPEHTYADYDFATGEAGEKFDCEAGATNDSRHNTGLEQLPPAEPAWMTYDDDSIPELGSGSESPLGGAVYNWDKHQEAETAFPEEMDGDLFIAEFGREWLKKVTLGENDEPEAIEDFPWDGRQIIDHEFGADGSLYVLDYGGGYFGGDDATALTRIDYAPDGATPAMKIETSANGGHAPLEIEFTAQPDDPEAALDYTWDFDGDGETDATGPTATHTYTEDGVYRAILRGTDESGRTGADGIDIVVGNTPPELEFESPAQGQFVEFGDTIDYSVNITDAEDAEIDCAAMNLAFGLGHDNHIHRMNSTTGCEGSIESGLADGHDTNQDVEGVLIAEYADQGAGELPPVQGKEQILLNNKHKQGEYHTSTSEGVEVVSNGDAEGGYAVGGIGSGDWVSFDPMNFAGVDTFSILASSASGATAELRAGSPDGETIATGIDIAAGGLAATDPVEVTDPGGTHEVFLVFTGEGDEVAQFDALTVTGTGAGGGGGA